MTRPPRQIARRLPDADRPPHRRLAPPRRAGRRGRELPPLRGSGPARRGRQFDAIFLADAVGVRNTDLPSLSRAARSDHFEPLTLLSALAAVTEKIGLIATVSTTYNEPYHVARKFASLDQISGGRSGWNLVTSSGQGEAQNFNLDEHVEHAQQRAAEFHDVVLGLGQLGGRRLPARRRQRPVLRPRQAASAASSRRALQVRGPLNVARSPQGRPVVVQAGASPAGRDLAARSAEVIFVAHQTFDEAQSFYRDIKRRAAGYGRDPDSIKVMPGIFPVVGHSQAEADEKFARLQDLIHPWSACSCCRT